jgi:23S rRNA (uracil1939-C5)-methyltransferase
MKSTNYPSESTLVPFEIEHIDPLGQGVSKITDEILFVRKTLPGEKGLAKILRKAKGVLFGEVVQLTHPSSKRIEPECPHFTVCQGCHFLHTNYENELDFKLQTWKRDFLHHSPYEQLPQTSVHAAPARLGYRTRIQLHYDHKAELLGFVDPLHKNIVPVQDCKIAHPSIKAKLDELYFKNSWRKLAKRTGHLELNLGKTDDDILVSINKRYSSGGFRQVYPAMNRLLLDLIKDLTSPLVDLYSRDTQIIDLFGGNGNLTQELSHFKTYVVDSFVPKERVDGHQEFHRIDLYSPFALPLFQKVVTKASIPLLILDPPRSGLKNLNEWVEALGPEYLFYISCNHSTQLRDLKPLWTSYELVETHLLDFFPSTFHFETFLVLKRRSS